MMGFYTTTSHGHDFSNLKTDRSTSLFTLADIIINPNDEVIFSDGDVAIIAAQDMNCGSMVYNFFDPGGENTAYSDAGIGNTLEFTICPEIAERQLLSFDFQALLLDNETLSVYDGNNSAATLINTLITGDSPSFQAGTSGTADGTGCVTFVLGNFDGAGEPSGFEAVITSQEFANTLTCLPFQELDGSGISPTQFNNGSVEIATCDSPIPNQNFSFSVGCSMVGNSFYTYSASVNNVPVTTASITSNPQSFTIPNSFLQLGNNSIKIETFFNGNNSVTTCTSNIPISTTQAFTCNDDLNIGLDIDCSATIHADILLEGTCEESNNYEIRVKLESPNPNFMDPRGITNPDDPDFISTDGLIATEQGTNNISLRVPGEYSYTVTLGNLTCAGLFTLEDKRGPICVPNGDMETPIFYDSDCDQIIDEERQIDPSGIDDLAPEYILCSVLEEAAQQPYGIDIFFDKLEGTNGFEDYDGDGVQDMNEPSFTSDFLDCTGIRSVFFEDEVREVCDFSDLNNIIVDETKYDTDRFEITKIYSRTWFAIDNRGIQSSRGATQFIFALRPKADQIMIDLLTTADCSDDIGTFCFQQSTAPHFQVQDGIVKQGLGSGRTDDEELKNVCAGQDATVTASDKVYFLTPGQNSCNYSISFQQEDLIPTCNSNNEAVTSYQTLRHYTILNWCDGSRVLDEFTSLINVEDTTPPSLQTPEGEEIVIVNGVPSIEVSQGSFEPYMIVLGSDFFNCEAAGSLPLFTIIDDCSATTVDRIRIERINTNNHDEQVVISSFINEDGLPANGGSLTQIEYAEGQRGLPLGLYDVTYFFSDDCGNATEIALPLTFEDNQRPQPICNDQLIVTLAYGNVTGEQGARIYGEDLDDTSRDACYPVILEVRRVDQPDGEWAAFVDFDCTDTTEEGIQIELRVTEDRDGDGRIEEGDLSNICWGRIKIEDKTPPTITAEDADYVCTDVEVDALILTTGLYAPEDGDSDFPTFVGGCTLDSVSIEILAADVSGFDPLCGVGIFTRDFRATRIIGGEPIMGNIVSQTIRVSFNAAWSMVFPTDIMITCDDSVVNNLDNVPAPLRIEDIIDNEGCDQWAMEVEDEVFDLIGQDGDGACFKIIRTYKFINWCTWDPTNSEIGVVPRPLDFQANPNLAVRLQYESDPVMDLCALRNNLDDANDNDAYDLLVSEFDEAFPNLADLSIADRDADFVYMDEGFPRVNGDAPIIFDNAALAPAEFEDFGFLLDGDCINEYIIEVVGIDNDGDNIQDTPLSFNVNNEPRAIYVAYLPGTDLSMSATQLGLSAEIIGYFQFLGIADNDPINTLIDGIVNETIGESLPNMVRGRAIDDILLDDAPFFNHLIDDEQVHDFVSAEAYGYFLYRQIIKVVDNEAPFIQPIDDLTICDSINVNGNCTANLSIAPPIVEECKMTYRIFYEFDQDNDGSIDLEGELAGNAIDGFANLEITEIPYATHQLRYIVEDGCGNNSFVDFTISARDCKAPTTYCKIGVNIDLNPNGAATIWASDLDAGSTDDCNNPVQVSFSTDPADTSRTFTCNDLGVGEVTLFAIDAAGNSSSCVSIVGIQSDSMQIDCPVGGLISGTITTEMGDEVANAMVYLSGNMSTSVPTSVTGGFNFNSLIMGGDYTLTPEKNYEPLNGVSTFDLIVLRKHILGTELLDSPYKMIAGDVNQSGEITTVDMLELRKLILGVSDDFANNTSWKFVDASYEFPDPNNPWSSNFPEYINYNNFSDRAIYSNFVAVKIGDVNASAVPNDLNNIDERNNEKAWTINIPQEGLTYDDIVTIPVSTDDLDVVGYQFTLAFDEMALELLEIKEGTAKTDNFGTSHSEEGIITASWDGILNAEQPLFSLVFRAKTTGQLSDFLNVNSDYTKTEAYNTQSELMDINVNFINTNSTTETVVLLQNEPNPFITQTTIGFYLDETDHVNLSIYDVTGKLLQQFTGTYHKGYQEVEVQASDLVTNGVLYYTLETTTTTITRKMILLAK